ncbi:LysR family transcriptional regulator [Bordetella pseudohinzii]|uniref:D-malate degradation protein R n=1 Tax=Bordetella pseudohinzii TaxID=1331258 RepID=A0A0J6C5R6_9BORD|nr:LysR family transcriptional regulator [Bordetella pseudohinzii]KMM26503.1 LysR family transcriptional regulator [Bordetella pseudohinzii]CUI78060.1 D-malate degradation protein R [Bordetella pseudohinzii]
MTVNHRPDDMALFVAAVDQGSLSAAARLTGLSLASVSRHMSALENRLGTRLLVRSTRKLLVTDAGRRYYQAAKRLLAEIHEMEAGLSVEATEPVGRLQLTAPILFGRVHLLPLLAHFLVRYPQVSLDVSLMDRPVNLLEEGIDIAVVVGQQPDSSLVARKLGAIRWALAASPGYLASRGEPACLADLAHHDGLVYSHYANEQEWQLRDGDQPAAVRPRVRMRANVLDGVVAAAVEGEGIVHAPAWAIADDVAAGRLRIVLPECETPPRPIYALLTHQRLLASRVRVLLDYLSESLARQSFA